MESTIGLIVIGAIVILMMYGSSITTMWTLREIRKQAAMLPEDRREVYLREAIGSLAEGLSETEDRP